MSFSRFSSSGVLVGLAMPLVSAATVLGCSGGSGDGPHGPDSGVAVTATFDAGQTDASMGAPGVDATAPDVNVSPADASMGTPIVDATVETAASDADVDSADASVGMPGADATAEAATPDASVPDASARDASTPPAPDAGTYDASVDAAVPIGKVPVGTSPAGTIIVNAATSTGGIRYGGIGWLYGLADSTSMPDERITGLVHPGYTGQMAPGGMQHSSGDAIKVAPQFKRTGGLGVSIYVQDYYAQWPYPNPGVASYMTNVVDKVTAAVASDPNRTFFQYVPFNEPDWIWYGNSGSKLTDFENDWKTVYNRIRSSDPGAVIIGPNMEHFDASAYDSFFSFAKSNNCLPNITSWHVLDTQYVNSFYSDYTAYRSIEAKYGITPIPIFNNEYGRSTGDLGRPGQLIQYLARFESTKVFGGLAFWDEQGRLDDLLATDLTQDGAWYLYQWYGQSTGTTVGVELPDQNGYLQAMAFTSAPNNVRVIFGGSANATDVFSTTVQVTGLTGSTVNYQVFETDYTELAYQAPPTPKTTATATVSKGQASIQVTGCKALSAYLVTLTPP